MKVGKLIVFTGPSGVGKGTVEKEFIHDPEFNFYFTVSAVTRKKRGNEVEGVDHLFITKEKFEQWIQENRFLEYVTYINNYYGTLKKEVFEKLDEGRNVFLEIELEGAKQIIEKYPEAISIFLLPPSIDELVKRLKNRNTESEEVFNARVKRSKEEIDYVKNNDIFKYQIINDDVQKCAEKIKEIIKRETNV